MFHSISLNSVTNNVKRLSIFSKSLIKHDPVLSSLINQEHTRQKNGIELIASENFTSKSVMECLGSVLTNKYSEGRPYKRYYGGNNIIDKIEELCEKRALDTFHIHKDDWAVNVQPYSGSVANLAVCTGILQPHDRLMGLDLPSGGHLSHGFASTKKKVNITSQFYESLPYVIQEDGWINYDDLEYRATIFRPKLLICGGSAYPRDWDYERLRSIANKIDAYLMCDMAHISGFIATGLCNNPFDYADIVTTTTHKTLRGPRAGMIFSKKHNGLSLKINESVFPGLQGGPHNNQIAAIATQLLEVQTPEFTEYCVAVIDNAKILAKKLQDFGYNISTDGTDTHIVLVNLKTKNITGSKVELVCEEVGISLNKNAVFGDKSALTPGGIRLGTSAMTSRGMDTSGFIKVAELLNQCIILSIDIQNEYGKKLVDFKKGIDKTDGIKELQREVEALAIQYEFY